MDTPIYEKMIARWTKTDPEEMKELYPLEGELRPVSSSTLED